MKTWFRRLAFPLFLGSQLLAPAGAQAQAAWPDAKPINLVVGFAAGGPTDTAARVVVPALAKRLGQTIVIENRPGASGIVGERYAMAQPADGYTLMLLVGPTVLSRHLTGLPFDFDGGYTNLGRVYAHHNILAVNTKADGMGEVKSVKDLVAFASANPDRLNFTSAGNGSIGHLLGQRMANMANIRMEHISYRGAAPAVTDTLGGQVPLIFSDVATLMPHIRSGRLDAIAVAAPQRLPELPEVPTLIEAGFDDLTAVPWGGLVAPAGLPHDIAQRLSAELQHVMSDPEVVRRLTEAGLLPAYLSPDAWGAQVKRDYTYWGNVIRENGIRSE